MPRFPRHAPSRARSFGFKKLRRMNSNNISDSLESSFRESLLEHVFLSELLQESWLRRERVVDILRPDVDRAGYDLVLECGGVSRYIQLKTSRLDAKTNRQTVNAKLADKLGGCVIWLFFDAKAGRVELEYRFFGGGPREKPNLGSKTGKHSKANAKGMKAERANTRQINRGDFVKLSGVGELIDKLFPEPALDSGLRRSNEKEGVRAS